MAVPVSVSKLKLWVNYITNHIKSDNANKIVRNSFYEVYWGKQFVWNSNAVKAENSFENMTKRERSIFLGQKHISVTVV